VIISFSQNPSRFFKNFVFFLVLLFGNLSCKPSSNLSTTPQTDATRTQTRVATDAPTPSPTSLPPLVVLLTPEGSDTEDAISLQGILTELAEEDGFRFELRNDLTMKDLESNVWLVVVVPPDPGILNLAAANPEVQFLAFGISGLQASQNISVIGSGGDRPDQQGFLAGYMGAAITQDWRVGVITPMDMPAGLASRNGFGNGVVFYCGLCRPAYPPFVQYPVFAELSTTSSETDQQAVVDLMVSNGVKTVFVYPGAGDEALLEYLAQAEVNIIGGTAPSGQVKNRWIASIRVDDFGALEQIWPRLVNGEQGISLEVPLVITDRNTTLFSPGRQHLVEKLLAEMLAGFIDTGVDPFTGELY
jgi:hypothetical protein